MTTFQVIEKERANKNDAVPHNVIKDGDLIATMVTFTEALGLVEESILPADAYIEEYPTRPAVKMSGETFLAEQAKTRAFDAGIAQ